jgi:hypothetical protein
LKCGGVQTCHAMDTWWLNVIRALLISGCVRNMDAQVINVCLLKHMLEIVVKLGLRV